MQTKPATILIIDDQPATLRSLAQTLQGAHTILVASTGQDALDIARSRSPDLILLDVMLPDISGLDVCRILKADPELNGIPVIFVTARDEAEDEAAGLDIGAIDYISKPFNPPIVRARVRNHLELKHQRDLLERIAMIDGLTGVANRRCFDRTLKNEWRRAMRSADPLALVLADVDHFKAYNDTYGHQDGDDCLRAIARTFEEQTQRSSDLVARYGGEEFVCLLPSTTIDGARQLASALCQAVRDLAIPHQTSSCGTTVSVSLGVSCVVPHHGLTPDDVLRHADTLLYRAKHAGRNQLVIENFPATATQAS